MSSADWAVHDIVRQGIDAHFRRQRPVEEEDRLLPNVERICRWLAQQTEVPVRALQSDLSTAMKKLIRIQLLHRDKVVLSFLRKVRKHGNLMMTAMRLRHLQELHEQIVGMRGTRLEHDVDHVDAEGEEPPGDQPQLPLTLLHHHPTTPPHVTTTTNSTRNHHRRRVTMPKKSKEQQVKVRLVLIPMFAQY
jgi:hypothetical protein